MKVKLTAAAALAALAFAQTPAVVVSPVPMLQFFDNNGKPLSGGQVCTYAAGTTTPLTTYTSSTGTTPNANPVILDASGRAAIWIAAPAIKYVLRAKGNPQNCSNGTTLYTVDGVQDQALKLRTDITGPNGLAMLTYTPPPTSITPTPVGGPIPMNQRAAQIVNVQDFDTPPFATCGVSSHDDTPASAKAANYVYKNGGGTVVWPRGGQCWFNSATYGSFAVPYFGSNVTFDGNGSTANTTVTGGFTIFAGPQLNSEGLPWAWWNDPTRQKCSFGEVFPGNLQITVSTGCGGRFHPGSAVYIQSGAVIGGTPTNDEGNVVADVNGDVLRFRYPIEHHFFYMNPPDGISEVSQDTFFNITWRNWRTAPQFTAVLIGVINCIHCQVLDMVGDFTGTGSLLSNNYMRDFLEDNIVLTVTNPNTGSSSPVVQFSTGTSDWTIRRSNVTCNAAMPGTFSVVVWTEGASNAVFENGSINGNCNIGGATYQTATLRNNQITLDTGPTAPEISWTGSGTNLSTNLLMAGNHMTFPNTASKTNISLAGDRLIMSGNRILSSATTATGGAVTLTQTCAGCIVDNNILTTGGYGFVATNLVNGHSFSLTGNNVTCTAATHAAFYVADDGQQTVGETIQGNTANGCANGLTVVNPAHEIGSFAPNAFAGNTTPYSPASLGGQFPPIVTGLQQIQNCPTPLTFTPIAPGLVIGCGATNGVWAASANGGATGFYVGTPATPNAGEFGIDVAGNLFIIAAGGQAFKFSGGRMQAIQPLDISGTSFTLNGHTCTATGTGNAIVCP